MYYDDRMIYSLEIGPMKFIEGHTGLLAVTCVRIALTADRDNGHSGPYADFNFGIPAIGTELVDDLRFKAVRRSFEMIRRLARENQESLAVLGDR